MLQSVSSVFVVYRCKTLTGSPDPTHANGMNKPCMIGWHQNSNHQNGFQLAQDLTLIDQFDKIFFLFIELKENWLRHKYSKFWNSKIFKHCFCIIVNTLQYHTRKGPLTLTKSETETKTFFLSFFPFRLHFRSVWTCPKIPFTLNS